MFDPYLALCQLAIWYENAVKFKPKLSKKMEGKNKQKRGGYGVGNKMQEVQIKLNLAMRTCGEAKNVSENYCANLFEMPPRLTGVMDVHLALEIIV